MELLSKAELGADQCKSPASRLVAQKVKGGRGRLSVMQST